MEDLLRAYCWAAAMHDCEPDVMFILSNIAKMIDELSGPMYGPMIEDDE